MPACLTAFLPDAATRWLLRTTTPVSLGRGEECSVRIAHPSVSRLHARLFFEQEAWVIEDAGSKNGLQVDGEKVSRAPLSGDTWFRLGDVACQWRLLDESEAARLETRGLEKRATSRFLAEGLERQTALPGLLQETLRATVELAECERGFLLLAEDGGLRVAASHGLAPSTLVSGGFNGSVGAVQQALASGRALVVNDATADPRWSARESVVSGGLRGMLCLPLHLGNELLALVYADSARPGCVITDTDLSLLEAFGERAALWIGARRGLEELSRLAPDRLAWPRVLEAQGFTSA